MSYLMKLSLPKKVQSNNSTSQQAWLNITTTPKKACFSCAKTIRKIVNLLVSYLYGCKYRCCG